MGLLVAVAMLEFTRAQSAFFALLAVPSLLVFASGQLRFVVNDSGFQIRGLLRDETVPWSAARRLRALGDRYQRIPGGNYWSRVQVLDYDHHGRRRTVFRLLRHAQQRSAADPRPHAARCLNRSWCQYVSIPRAFAFSPADDSSGILQVAASRSVGRIADTQRRPQ